MRCLNCNCEVPDKSVFCPECGQKFEGGNTYWRRPQSHNCLLYTSDAADEL